MIISSVLIVGLGLVGGSIAELIREKHSTCRLYGISRSQSSIDFAKNQGIIHDGWTALCDAPTQVDCVIVATPIHRVMIDIDAVSKHLESPCIITDVSSVKASIEEALPPLKAGQVFIPGHPMAGSDKTGVQHASADIMRHAHYILVPNTSNAYLTFKDFLKTCGFRLLEMSSSEHDTRVAYASHFPYLMASLIVSTYLKLAPEKQAQIYPVIAKGFYDTTRVSGSDPTWGRDICLTNKDAILSVLDAASQELTDLKERIESDDADALDDFFSTVSSFRQSS